MIKIGDTETVGWEHAIRGMRNPMNSWEKSDSLICEQCPSCVECPVWNDGDCKSTNPHDLNAIVIGPNDHELMMKLAAGGPVHAKYRRMIVVYVDITAPLYWWKEFDTYKVGTVANSCSTMHKIHEKEFSRENFSCEHLSEISSQYLDELIEHLNFVREVYNEDKTNKGAWWQMIQLLPASYNQRRTVMLNYEVLAGIYPMRKDHKLDEWRDFCRWIERLPYSEIITGGV